MKAKYSYDRQNDKNILHLRLIFLFIIYCYLFIGGVADLVVSMKFYSKLMSVFLVVYRNVTQSKQAKTRW